MDLKTVPKLVQQLMSENARSVTKLVSDKLTVRISRTTFKGKFNRNKLELVITVGKPNWEAREFIKKLKKSGKGVFNVTYFKYPKRSK